MGCLSTFIILVIIGLFFEHWYLTVPLGLLIYFGYRSNEKKKQEEGKERANELAKKVESEGLTVVDTSLMLKSGERCYYQGAADRLITTRRVTRYEGGSRGISVKVAKDLTLRGGSSKGVPIREDVIDRFKGEVVITNKRIVFLGNKGFEFNLGQITALDHYADAIAFQVKGTRYVIASSDIDYIQIIVDEVMERHKLQRI